MVNMSFLFDLFFLQIFDFNSYEFFQNYTIFNITNSGKTQLLQSINLYRNSIALGNCPSFEKASNMRMMVSQRDVFEILFK